MVVVRIFAALVPRLFVGAATFCLIVASHAAGPADRPAPLSLEAMTAPAQVLSMTLSPSGKQIAGLLYNGFGAAVFLMDLEDFRVRSLVTPTRVDRAYTRSPVRVLWVADDLLAVDFNDLESEAIDLSGKKVSFLGERVIRRAFADPARPPEVFAYRSVEDHEIDRVNARTGEREKYRVSLRGKMIRSAFDAQGRLRAATMLDSSIWKANATITNWYRADDRSEWQLLATFGVADDPWWPLFVLDEPGTMAILSRRGRDTYAVFRYEVGKRAQGEAMAAHPDEDIENVAAESDASFTSVLTEGLKPSRYWFDPRMAGLQGAIDKALPERVNTLSPVLGGRVLVFSYSDVDPGRWFLLQTDGMKLRELEAHRPRVDPGRMQPTQTVVYPARDGLALNAYLTLPPANDRLPPLVVLIHGGPNVRDHWGWNQEVQILATRGYAVFQPQFRGSTGFGKRYERSGDGQWGRAMQDDISDGVRFLIEQKIVDPARICISGGSYGGYAALWGAIKTPELYRCGISFAGVSDLADLINDRLFTDSTAFSREWNRARVGDPATQRRELDAVSPLLHAADVRIPLLIAHGDKDPRVPISHSLLMVRALQANGKDVEWMPFEGEGHGLSRVGNIQRYYAAMLDFLKRHIGETASPGLVKP
jgi:dipeptidyl aminopeptidase/acylaminoacyl peptidase